MKLIDNIRQWGEKKKHELSNERPNRKTKIAICVNAIGSAWNWHTIHSML